MKPSDRTQRLEENEIAVRDALTDLLLHGPSSFAAIFGFIARTTERLPNVARLLALLERMETEGQIKIVKLESDGSTRSISELDRVRAQQEYEDWLSGLSRIELSTDALAVDEIGLWCALTDSGRQARIQAEEADWALDVVDQEQLVRVQAKTEKQAESVLQTWLARDKTIELVPSSREVTVAADSRVEVTWRFRPK